MHTTQKTFIPALPHENASVHRNPLHVCLLPMYICYIAGVGGIDKYSTSVFLEKNIAV